MVVACKSGYSCHHQDKQILGGCICNQEGQAAVQYYIESVRLFRRFGGGRYKPKKCSMLCCRVIDACTISNDVRVK